MILCWYSAMISMGWPPSRRPPSWASSSVRPCCGRRKAWFRSTRCIRQKWLNCSLNTSTPFSGRHWNRLRRLLLLWRQRLCPTVVVVVQLSDPLNRPKRNWNDFRHHLPRCCPKWGSVLEFIAAGERDQLIRVDLWEEEEITRLGGEPSGWVKRIRKPVIMVVSVLITAPCLKQRYWKRRFCLLRYNCDALIESRAIVGFSSPDKKWKIGPFDCDYRCRTRLTRFLTGVLSRPESWWMSSHCVRHTRGSTPDNPKLKEEKKMSFWGSGVRSVK